MVILDLQLFGGRGGGSGGSGGGGYVKGSSDGTLMRAKKRTIETTMIERPTLNRWGWSNRAYKTEVLEATTDGKGNVSFSYATPTSNVKTAKTNKTHDLTYELAHGAVDGKTFGIDWSKVKSISGQTYSVKDEAKAAGLKFDGATKTWRRK